jgi:hypothetical protein
VGVEQRGPQRVFELPLAEPQASAQPANHVRRLAHALRAAGQDDVRFAELQQLRAAHRRLDSGAAQAIHRQRRHLDRDAGLEPDMTRAVHRVRAGLQDVAVDDVIDVRGLDTRALHRRARRNRAELQRGNILQLARVFRHRRSCAAKNENVTVHPVPLSSRPKRATAAARRSRRSQRSPRTK